MTWDHAPAMTCATCPAWNPREDGAPSGQCRNDSPRLARNGNGNVNTMWPITKRTDWCMRHPERGRAAA